MAYVTAEQQPLPFMDSGLRDIPKEEAKLRIKKYPDIRWDSQLELDPNSIDPLYRYSDGFNFEMRPTLVYLWQKVKDSSNFKKIFKQPPIDELIWKELKWTAKRSTSWIVQTVGPMESGKSWFNISLAHFLRDMYLIFLQTTDKGEIINPRIYVTFDYRDTVEVLKSPNYARRALIPVQSKFFPEELELDVFDITWDDIESWSDEEVLPREGDIIVQDERPRLRGLGSRSTMDNLNNIIETSRKKRINFFFASPTKLDDLSIINDMFEMFGRDFKRFYSRIVIYDILTNALGIAHFPIYPDWRFFRVYEARKDEQIEERLKSGGTVAGIDKKKIANDVGKVMQTWMDMMGPTTKVTKSLVKSIVLQTLPAETTAYVDMIVDVAYQQLKAGAIMMPPQEEVVATTPQRNRVVIDAFDDEGVEDEGDIDERTIDNGSEQGERDMEIFDYEDVAREILDTEQMIQTKGIDWQAVQMAYYYRMVLGLTTEATIRKLRDEGFRISDKFVREQVRNAVADKGYFAQLKNSLKTKIGFRYEKWTLEHYWKKHPQVAEAESYKAEGKSHQATPDIILTLKDGRKVAVAVKVKTSANLSDPITFKKRGKWNPEWTAFLNGEVDLVVLDVWQVTFGRAFRKIVHPRELENRNSVRIDITYTPEGDFVDTGEDVDFEI